MAVVRQLAVQQPGQLGAVIDDLYAAVQQHGRVEAGRNAVLGACPGGGPPGTRHVCVVVDHAECDVGPAAQVVPDRVCRREVCLDECVTVEPEVQRHHLGVAAVLAGHCELTEVSPLGKPLLPLCIVAGGVPGV
jgi:hypothetical protein